MLKENRCSSCGALLPPNSLVCNFCGAAFTYIEGDKIVSPGDYYIDRLNEAKTFLIESIKSPPISQGLFTQSLTLFGSLILPENHIVITNTFFDVLDDCNYPILSNDIIFITEALKPKSESNKLLQNFHSKIILNFYFAYKRQFFKKVQKDYDYHNDNRFENITDSWFIKRKNAAIRNYEDTEKEFNDFIGGNKLGERINEAIYIIKNQENNE